MHFTLMEALVLTALAVAAFRVVGSLISLSPTPQDNTVSSV